MKYLHPSLQLLNLAEQCLGPFQCLEAFSFQYLNKKTRNYAEYITTTKRMNPLMFNTKHFKGRYEARLEFPGGCGGSNQKNPPLREYGYFLE